MLRMFILFIAISAGGAAAWVATTTSSPAPVVVASPGAQPTAEVLVTAAPLQRGAVLTREDMRWQNWPEDAMVEGYIRRTGQSGVPDDLVGQFARGEFLSGEPIRAEKFSQSAGGMLSVILEPGMRAVAVRISAESTAGGFIMPNDRVDVLRTIGRQRSSGQSETVSEAILRNVRVLAIDQSTDAGDGATVLGKTATLELAVNEVEIVIAAEASGLLSLALRSFADTSDGPRIVDTPVSKPAIRVFRAGVMEQVVLQ